MTTAALAKLDSRTTPTTLLQPGDAFTCDAGSGVLVFVSQPCERMGTRRSTLDPVRALDLSGQTHTVHTGARVRVLLDLDTLPHCDTCSDGCYCSPGSAGCGHFGCWAATTDATCKGATKLRIKLYSRVAQRTQR